MPRKIRQLKADLLRAECTRRPAKGSHTYWTHSLLPGERLSLSGNDGDDAKPYQEKYVRKLLKKIEEVKRRQP